MYNEIKRSLTDVLNEIGGINEQYLGVGGSNMAAHRIADALKTAGIKGRRNAFGNDPLARFLSMKLRAALPEVKLVRLMSNYISVERYDGGQTSIMYMNPDEPYVCTGFEGVYCFIQLFDASCFPELDESPSAPILNNRIVWK